MAFRRAQVVEVIPDHQFLKIIENPDRSCPHVWDPVNAHFEVCSLPYISAIPAVVTVCILLVFLLGKLRCARRPRWARAFVEEPKEEGGDFSFNIKRSSLRQTWTLLLVSTIGLALQVVTVFLPRLRIEMVYPAASWAVATFLIAIRRPVTTPISLLILYSTVFASQVIILVDGASPLHLNDAPRICAILSAMGLVIVIMTMPMRDPSLPSEGISPVFGPPSLELRSPEDNLTLWQFMSVSWMKPLMLLGNKRQLHDEDVWKLSWEFQHKMLHDTFKELQGSVLKRLAIANGLDLFIISALGVLELICDFANPVLLQKILQCMESPTTPKLAALKYAILTLVVRLIAAQSGVFTLWFGRRAYERSRGEMVTMLYEKTLSRKVVSVSSKAVMEVDVGAVPNGTAKHSRPSRPQRILNFFLKPFHLICSRSKSKTPTEKVHDFATMGKILNLMRFDAYNVAQRFWEFSNLVSLPLGIIFSVILIWRLLGWPCLIGVLVIFVAQAVNTFFGRALLYWEKKRRVAADTKIQKISQFVDAIRHLRYYGWQDIWLGRIMDARQHELHILVTLNFLRILINFTNVFASGLFPVVAFWAYTVLSGKPLRVDVAFPALQLFSMLELSLRELPNMIPTLLSAIVSVRRLDEFMQEPDKEDAEAGLSPGSQIELKDASFSWPGSSEPVLFNINLKFPTGLTVICGEVGAGKTALLQALLGEVDLVGGEYHRSGEMVGYCGQIPWLQSMSIRENILFSAPFEEARYRQVLEVCALVPDMALFKHGDLSLVGENGVGLSGGQKARISLARAVYSKANTLLLDDPLSALDHQTAEFIARKCLKGPLLEGRTTILVTHRTELCLSLAVQAVRIFNGRATLLDPETIPFEELHKESLTHEDSRAAEEQESAAAPDKFMEDEHRAHGGVQAKVYWEYIKAGNLKWWVVLIVALALYRTIEIGETWFLKSWGEAYGRVGQAISSILHTSSSQNDFLAHWFFKPWGWTEISTNQANSDLFGRLPSPDTNIRPWLIGFLLIAISQAVAFLISRIFMIGIIYNAGKELFERVMVKVAHATFRFYDVTPTGRLMNRVTSDMSTVDGNISIQFQTVAVLSISWISSIVVIGSVTPFFLIFAVGLTLAFVVIFTHFLPTSQSLRRLEMVSLTPLISNFGALTDGLTTVRAFCASSRFHDRVIAVTDDFQKMDHFYWSLQAWLMFRFDSISAFSNFLLTAMALYTGVSAGLTAFVLTASSKFVSSTHSLCKTYGQLQMDFVSVERVVELLHLDQEPPGNVAPPASWPLYGGDIVFENVTIKYAPHLEPALSDISLKIKGGSTTALIGRTGSGKSTLALSLLFTIAPVSGRILIDGIDISTVELQALRKRVTFLAQEPVLFPGTMRQNLDPLEEYTDAECEAVLEKIARRHEWVLDTHIDTGGKNISQGQRQLVGLARALLRRSPIIIMDEATASIDKETSMRIQEILREEMKESTVITIAHRVEAVSNCDFCVVLAKGKILEQGSPEGLVKRMES